MQDLVRLYGIVEYPRSTSEIKGKTKKIAKFQLPDKESFSITYFLKKSILFCFFQTYCIIVCILRIYRYQ